MKSYVMVVIKVDHDGQANPVELAEVMGTWIGTLPQEIRHFGAELHRYADTTVEIRVERAETAVVLVYNPETGPETEH